MRKSKSASSKARNLIADRRDFLWRRKMEMAELGSVKASAAAEFLGISVARIYALRQAGVLTFAIVGGRIVFPVKALQEYLAAQTFTGDIA